MRQALVHPSFKLKSQLDSVTCREMFDLFKKFDSVLYSQYKDNEGVSRYYCLINSGPFEKIMHIPDDYPLDRSKKCETFNELIAEIESRGFGNLDDIWKNTDAFMVSLKAEYYPSERPITCLSDITSLSMATFYAERSKSPSEQRIYQGKFPGFFKLKTRNPKILSLAADVLNEELQPDSGGKGVLAFPHLWEINSF